MKRKILKYILIPICSYWFTKRFFPTPKDKQDRERDKKIPYIIKDPEPIDIILPVRGGFLSPDQFWKNFCSLCSENRYLLMGLLSLCGVAVGDRFTSVLNEILRGASPAIVAMPSPLFRKLLAGFQSASVQDILSGLKRGLLSKELNTEEKLTLLKKSLVALRFVVLDKESRRSLFLSIFLILLSVAFQQTGLLGGGIICFQEIFSKTGLSKATVEYIVDQYYEYNAPLPEELVTLLTSVKSTS